VWDRPIRRSFQQRELACELHNVLEADRFNVFFEFSINFCMILHTGCASCTVTIRCNYTLDSKSKKPLLFFE